MYKHFSLPFQKRQQEDQWIPASSEMALKGRELQKIAPALRASQ